VKRVRFIAAARLEFLAEVVYYNEAQPELGERFTAAVEAAALAVAFPLSIEDASHDCEGFPVLALLPARAR
jgi:hypothetical protein